MTQLQKRIKIAEACGWTDIHLRWNDAQCCIVYGKNPRPDAGDDSGRDYLLPNYFDDLNVCHEMEKALTIDQQNTMNDTLFDMMQGRKYLWFATASEHAEAFGKTLNLW